MTRKVLYRWDLDKTYLQTEFDTFRDLVRTALEPVSNKQTVPGATTLLHEVQATDSAGVHILSGSPEQMRRVLEAKLRADGIRWEAFTLKPALKNLARGRFRFLRDQVTYKLTALLRSRTVVDAEFDEIMFGDDAEADAYIYSLYADIAANRVPQAVLMEFCELAQVYPQDIPEIVRVAARVPRRDAIRRIFIHLERVSPIRRFSDFGNRVVPFYNYFQPALVLYNDGYLSRKAALRVGAELILAHAFTPDVLLGSFDDLARRGFVSRRRAEKLSAARDKISRSAFGDAADELQTFAEAVAERIEALPASTPVEVPPIDYLELFEADRARALAAKKRATWSREI